MTETKTIIEALRILARDIQSEDGVANAAIAEAADRLEKQQKKIRNQRREIEALAKDKQSKQEETVLRLAVRKVLREMEVAWNREAPTREELHSWGKTLRDAMGI